MERDEEDPMLDIVKERLPGKAKYRVLKYLRMGVIGIENIANLDALPASGATLFVGAPKHRNGTGGPARIMAMV